jgi:hypothetical protein
MSDIIYLLTFRFLKENHSRRFSKHLFIALVFLSGIPAAFNSPVAAQGNTSGGFVGRVTERGTNTPIPNAIVTFRNIDTGLQAAARSDSSGNFSYTSLPPGTYEITAKSEPGYLPSAPMSLTLQATRFNQVIPVPIELEKIQTVTVTTPQPTPQPTPSGATTPSSRPAAAPAGVIDTEETVDRNPRREGTFDKTVVETLPLGGTTLTRTFDELAFFVPGVMPPPQAIGNTVGPGIGGGVGTSGQFSVNGLRSRANNFTVDGSDNNDEDIGVRRQGFFALVPQPIESIREFGIITLLAPAEFGRNLGAQVNANSQAGGNRFRGTIYGFFNSDELNARNFFDGAGGDTSTLLNARQGDGTIVPVFVNGQRASVINDAGEKDEFRLLQGGFAVGGRIIRDKLFFFVSGEGQSLKGTRERNFAVPTVEQRGLFDSGAAGLEQCNPHIFFGFGQSVLINGQCAFFDGANLFGPFLFSPGYPTSVGGDAVFSLFPFANNPNGIYGRNTYTQALSTDAKGRILSGRADWNAFRIGGNQQTFTARYNNTHDERDLTDVGGALFSAIRPVVRTDNFSTFLNGGVTANTANEFRFSWGRTRLRFDELRDETGFLRGFSSGDSRFLLNAPFLLNETLPSVCTTTRCFSATQVDYSTFGTTAGNSTLGPIGQLIIAGFSPIGVDVFNFPQERANNTYQIADTFRWRVGRGHSLAFGADIRRTYLDSTLPRNSRALVTFNGGLTFDATPGGSLTGSVSISPLSLAASGAATGFFQTLRRSGSDERINLSYNQLNFFVQDDWRPHPKLTVNFGLRYEYNTTPKEADSKIESTFGTQLPTFLSGLSSFIDGRTQIYNPDTNNFAPRIGVAYAPTNSTVIRGGFGIYYDQILGAVVSQSRNVFPTFTTANFGGGQLADNFGVFTLFNPANAVFDRAIGLVCNRLDVSPCTPATSIPLIQPGTLNTFNSALTQAELLAALSDIYGYFPEVGSASFGTTLPSKQLETPMSYQYSIGVEQKLFGNTFVSVAYVGTRGRTLLRFTSPNLGSNYINLFNRFDLNFEDQPEVIGRTLSPFRASDCTAAFILNCNITRPTANAGVINQFETTGRSRYDSLQIEVRGRFGNSFQYRTNYVYGKVEDDASDVFDLAGAFALPQNSLTSAGEYAPANFDVRHRFTYNFIYDLPRLRNRGAFVRTLLGGWQIAGTGRYNTGQPFTVNSIYDVNLDGNLTDRLNNTQFIEVTGDRHQPLRLTSSNTADLFRMLAPIGRDGEVPRNSFRAGNVLELDMSVIKYFRFTDTQSLQFRADFFNFINRANFGIPVRFLEAPGFGQAINTVTPGRRIQFALKYTF